ncbi:MAG: methyltransferase domain-containing protein [Chitinophagaceae bacterium]|nr:MAG: methyltransferase domain-containing protein [Chitinophagaceae bacterium]
MKPDFRIRSYEPELLDRPGIPFADIADNMRELDVINTRLGGHRITLKGVQALLRYQVPGTVPHIAEIGCGGGDNLRAIRRWADKRGLELRLTGIDYNPECIAYAEGRAGNSGIAFVCSDYRDLRWTGKPDILFSSLFCHHFTDGQLLEQLRWMEAQSRSGFFINDLHRHPLAWYSIRLLTRLFSKSYMVKADAPLSVRRAFLRAEWEELLRGAGITRYRCSWQWAFRWLILVRNHEQ